MAQGFVDVDTAGEDAEEPEGNQYVPEMNPAGPGAIANPAAARHPRDRTLQRFIDEYSLHQIEEQLHTEGITTNFLLSQSDEQIDAIVRELTASIIQQNKFKYAVQQIKAAKQAIADATAKQQALPPSQPAPMPISQSQLQHQSLSKHDPRPGQTYASKLVMLGETRVGKSSVMVRFVKNVFSEYPESTIGAAFLTQTVGVKDYHVKFEIWDTAGQERYHALAPMYYRGAKAAICVYDITSMESFKRAQSWVKELQQQGEDIDVIAFVGNKLDLEEERAVMADTAKLYADQNQLVFMEVSAKTNLNIRELFVVCASRVQIDHEAIMARGAKSKESLILPEPAKPSKCCEML